MVRQRAPRDPEPGAMSPLLSRTEPVVTVPAVALRMGST
jgi:hypothetical protein